MTSKRSLDAEGNCRNSWMLCCFRRGGFSRAWVRSVFVLVRKFKGPDVEGAESYQYDPLLLVSPLRQVPCMQKFPCVQEIGAINRNNSS